MVRPLWPTGVLLAICLVQVLQTHPPHLQNARAGFIVGQWSDACPCKIPCPCWRTRRSSSPNCVNVHVFRITDDESAGTNLAGSVFVLLQIPRSAYAAPSPETLFLDRLTPADKSVAIETLIRSYFGAVKTVRVPLRFSENEHGQSVQIPGVLTYRVRPLREPPLQTVADYLYPWLSDPIQGVAVEVTYRVPGHKTIRYSETNSIFAQFRLLRPDRLRGEP